MRTIKFRGKRCDNSEWVCGYYVGCTETWKGGHFHKSWIITSARSNGGFFALQGRYPVQDQTIGQYTGMHDKNGKEIYEGDIVKMSTAIYGDEIFKVSYENSHIGAFCLCYDEQEDTSRFVSIFGRDYGYEPFYCEVIGNIHDNPELLKGGEK